VVAMGPKDIVASKWGLLHTPEAVIDNTECVCVAFGKPITRNMHALLPHTHRYGSTLVLYTYLLISDRLSFNNFCLFCTTRTGIDLFIV
jgi:hypothetical protein